jgi:hypothetical protein
MIPGEALTQWEAVEAVLSFCARVVRKYMSHVLYFPLMLSYSPPKEELNMLYFTTWRQCSAFCMIAATPITHHAVAGVVPGRCNSSASVHSSPLEFHDAHLED